MENRGLAADPNNHVHATFANETLSGLAGSTFYAPCTINDIDLTLIVCTPPEGVGTGGGRLGTPVRWRFCCTRDGSFVSITDASVVARTMPFTELKLTVHHVLTVDPTAVAAVLFISFSAWSSNTAVDDCSWKKH